MLNVTAFGLQLETLGFNFYSGVPCSYLKPLINYAISEQNYLAAVNEGDAVAHCAGAWLGGRKSVVLMQNSGLGNAVSPLTSLNAPFKIPVLGFVSHRGAPDINDEPQHQLMGPITAAMLSTMKIAHQVLSDDEEKAQQQLVIANQFIEQGKSYFFIVKKNTFNTYSLNAQSLTISSNQHYSIEQGTIQHSRTNLLTSIRSTLDDNCVVLTTTGITGRELYQLGHKKNQLYMVGSMGCVSALGLGIAKVCPHLKVIVIDGDGALLMRMGNLATVGNDAVSNICHILLDNGIHESTGGQQTVSSGVDFSQIAKACGYEQVKCLFTPEQMQQTLSRWLQHPVKQFIHCKILPGHPEPLVRPKETPDEITKIFRANIMQKMKIKEATVSNKPIEHHELPTKNQQTMEVYHD